MSPNRGTAHMAVFQEIPFDACDVIDAHTICFQQEYRQQQPDEGLAKHASLQAGIPNGNIAFGFPFIGP